MNDCSCCDVLLWVKNRSSYVTPINSCIWKIKDSATFGITSRGPEMAGGKLTEFRWDDVIQNFCPQSVEIIGTPCPANELVGKLSEIPAQKEKWCENLRCISIIGASTMSFDDLRFLIEASTNLTFFHLRGIMFDNAEMSDLLTSLRKCQQLCGISLVHSFSDVQLDHWFGGLNQYLDFVLFGFPSSLTVSAFMKATVACGKVDMVAFKALASAEEFTVACVAQIGKLFPSLKCLYLDWNLIDTEFVFDDRTVQYCDAILNIYKRQELSWVSILVYTPTPDMRIAAHKLSDHFSATKCLPTNIQSFQSFGMNNRNLSENFFLVSFGDLKDTRLKRLFEAVIDKRNSSPEISDFGYVQKGELFRGIAQPDLHVEFGGLNKEEILDKQGTTSEIEFVADEVQNRFLSGAG